MLSGALRASREGSVEFSFEGIARASFPVRQNWDLRPPPRRVRGGAISGTHPGRLDRGPLAGRHRPQLPGSHGFGEPLFPSFHELELTRSDGIGVALAFDGDLFELDGPEELDRRVIQDILDTAWVSATDTTHRLGRLSGRASSLPPSATLESREP